MIVSFPDGSLSDLKPLKKIAVIIFSKAPIEGQVKTRLAKSIGDFAALNVYKALLKVVVTEIADDRSWDCYLSAASELDHPVFKALSDEFNLGFHLQRDGDLGLKMFDCLQEMLEHYDKAIIVGGDAVSISCSVISQVFDHLSSHAVSFVPALDGGYIAIGAESVHSNMFDGIEWGTEKVLTQQINQLEYLKKSFCLTERYWDLDEYEDFERMKQNATLYQKMLHAGLNPGI